MPGVLIFSAFHYDAFLSTNPERRKERRLTGSYFLPVFQ